MKTETQIAEDNVRNNDNKDLPLNVRMMKNVQCKEHKATCQRWLEFLENDDDGLEYYYEKFNFPEDNVSLKRIIENKITDLKQAIKLYNEAGIK